MATVVKNSQLPLATSIQYNVNIMEIHENIPLKNFTTMRLGGPARYMADAHSADELAQLIMSAKNQNIAFFILGGGSNTIARDEGFGGLVIRNMIKGIEVIAETGGDITFKVGAGENWDEFVKMTVERRLTGLECLSMIPGTVGAAPVQNIGAYGQEVAETILQIDAFDSSTNQFTTLQNLDCNFGYRDSIFRGSEMGRYGITYVTFRLFKSMPQPPFYKGLEDYFTKNNVTVFTPQIVRDAVVAIRMEKLPDPKERPNTGSFFKNAIIEQWQYTGLLEQYPGMPSFEMAGGNRKIPTGWLIDQTGLKGQLLHGMRVHDKNALVLINEAAASYADLAAAREEIKTAVRAKFQIEIEQEPLEL